MKGARAALAFAGILPWLHAILGARLPDAVNRAVWLAFAALCHHAPERTLVLGGEAMCVCSRCAGLYAGFAVAALLPCGKLPVHPKKMLGFGAVFMVGDILLQDLGAYSPVHAVRLLTGAIVGVAAAGWMVAETRPSGRDRREVDGGEALPG